MFQFRTHLLKLWRASLVVAVVALIHFQSAWLESKLPVGISLEQARRFFPQAQKIVLHDAESGLHHALDSEGETVGGLLTTSPAADSVIGYSGPSNLLVALDPAGAVAGVELLRSADTPEHLELINETPSFLASFKGWKPNQEPAPKVSAVSGATLTSHAIAEALSLRLTGSFHSLRFPDSVTLSEVAKLFPQAGAFEPEGRRFRVFGPKRETLGFVLRTSPEADAVSGYRGPTECLVGLGPDGETVTGLKLRKSYDSEDYVDYLYQDESYLNSFRGRRVADIAKIDFKTENIEGVSGATQTSWAVAESLKRRMASEVNPPPATGGLALRAKDLALAGALIGAALMAFTPLRGKAWLRLGWQALLIVYVGLVCGGLLSLSLFQGWAAHGPPLAGAPGLALLGLAALILPWASRRQLYCHQICPHGAAQQCLGALGKKLRSRKSSPSDPKTPKRPAAARLAAVFASVPALFLAGSIIAVLLGLPVNLATIEPFDAWVWQAAGAATISIAVIGLIASFFIPQAYCRFGCPTGAIFNFVRSSGSADQWGSRDWAALGLLAAGLLAVAGTRSVPPESPPAVASLQGSAMGTTWSVKIRLALHDPAALKNAIKAELETVENLASTWRSKSVISRFNQNRTTGPFPGTEDLAWLVEASAGVSAASSGAFDVTVGPLVRLWGFGPSTHPEAPPSNEQIDALRDHLGWRKLSLSGGLVAKADPKLEMDLSSIAEGWAVDRVATLLKSQGHSEFLVEIGGEIRVSGPWTILVEHPNRTCHLRDEAISTSGTYRQFWKADGKEFSHLLDPRTGRPVTHRTVSVSVRHADCALADAWSTALNVMGESEGFPLAEKLGLAVQFVSASADGRLEVRSTAAWLK